jgi:hypothetical protein
MLAISAHHYSSLGLNCAQPRLDCPAWRKANPTDDDIPRLLAPAETTQLLWMTRELQRGKTSNGDLDREQDWLAGEPAHRMHRRCYRCLHAAALPPCVPTRCKGLSTTL